MAEFFRVIIELSDLYIQSKFHVTHFAKMLQFFLCIWQAAFISGDLSIMSEAKCVPIFDSRFKHQFSSHPKLSDLITALRFLGYECSHCRTLGSTFVACTTCEHSTKSAAAAEKTALNAYRANRAAWGKSQNPKLVTVHNNPASVAKLDAAYKEATGISSPSVARVLSLQDLLFNQTDIPAPSALFY